MLLPPFASTIFHSVNADTNFVYVQLWCPRGKVFVTQHTEPCQCNDAMYELMSAESLHDSDLSVRQQLLSVLYINDCDCIMSGVHQGE